jgi:hypothetical protein
MSNTLNTPIEALEREFPLRVTEYALRRGSGGAGRHRGGDGVVRELEALEPMTFSLIAERRRHPPRGARGGEPGERGRDELDGRPCPARSPEHSSRASGCASKRRVEEDSGVSERIGFLGLGIMGSRMAANVAAAGFPLSVWTHTKGKAERWASEHDASACATPAEVARASDIVLSMVVDDRQVSDILLGPDGVLDGAQPGLLCVDSSTISPAGTRSIGAALASSAGSRCSTPPSPAPPRGQRTGRSRSWPAAGPRTSPAQSHCSKRWAA